MIQLIFIHLFFLPMVCLCPAQMLNAFKSYNDLNQKSDWIGILEIGKVYAGEDPHNETHLYECRIVHVFKGAKLRDQKNKVDCKLVDCAARTDKAGDVLDALSQDLSLRIGDLYFAFCNESPRGLTYIPYEGAVLRVMPTAPLISLVKFSPEKAFVENILEYNKFCQQQAMHAKLQVDSFTGRDE